MWKNWLHWSSYPTVKSCSFPYLSNLSGNLVEHWGFHSCHPWLSTERREQWQGTGVLQSPAVTSRGVLSSRDSALCIAVMSPIPPHLSTDVKWEMWTLLCLKWRGGNGAQRMIVGRLLWLLKGAKAAACGINCVVRLSSELKHWTVWSEHTGLSAPCYRAQGPCFRLPAPTCRAEASHQWSTAAGLSLSLSLSPLDFSVLPNK